MQKNKA